jgi:hypothetical protein
MKTRFFVVFLIIITIPFIIGIPFFVVKKAAASRQTVHFVTDTRESGDGKTYKGITIDWTFCPDWKYKPLLFPSEEYLVFMFHYTNNSEYTVQVMPSYTLVSPQNRRYSANEEIAMYIEDELENKLNAEDQTPITFEIPPNVTKRYIVAFEKPHLLNHFYVDVDVFRDVTLRLYYNKENEEWSNDSNELVRKYKGRG